MFTGDLQIRAMALLVLTAMAAGSSAMMSGTAAAADTETFFSNPSLEDFIDGDVKVARMGQRGPGVHMSFISPAEVRQGEMVNASAVRQSSAMPEVYLSIRLPW